MELFVVWALFENQLSQGNLLDLKFFLLPDIQMV